jgi:hypothetical protein
VTPFISDPRLLVLHSLRLTGVGDAVAISRRFGLDLDEVTEHLLDFEALGWIRHVEFAGVGGWALTDTGRVENELQLADELAKSGAGAAVLDALAAFLPLNARFQTVCTDWQVRPLPCDPMAANDHMDCRWDDRVLDSLGSLGRRLEPLCVALSGQLARFDGYTDRYAAAMSRVERGELTWIDGVGLDSCHTVWFELHEDLIATLGLQRGQEPSREVR